MTQNHYAGPRSSRVTDPAFVRFLRARRDEEARAAAARAEAAVGPDGRSIDPADGGRRDRTGEGLAVLDELIAGLEAGRDLDAMQLPLIKIAYGRHPDFRPEWHSTLG
ncbi:hypothetical protein [Agilicoccus flavus]|uniref:hypothetical protein n=1 Tax=Agilicoccus flavus TaxID=2775968 RepID=UPI001CF6EB45|nr:hypothetical protein [Agilicoccus flavus]